MDYYYTVKQASLCLGCHEKTVTDLIHTGKLQAEKDEINGRYRIPTEEIHKMAMDLNFRRGRL